VFVCLFALFGGGVWVKGAFCGQRGCGSGSWHTYLYLHSFMVC